MKFKRQEILGKQKPEAKEVNGLVKTFKSLKSLVIAIALVAALSMMLLHISGSEDLSNNYPQRSALLQNEGKGFSSLQATYVLIYDVNGGLKDSINPRVRFDESQNAYSLEKFRIPQHRNLEGQNVVFIGWSQQRDTKIYMKNDQLPLLIDHIAISEGQTTVYAIWGFDSNKDGVADVLQATYNLHYDVNGGIIGSGPERQQALLPNPAQVLSKSPRPERKEVNGQKVKFIGWSLVADTKIYSKDDALPLYHTTVEISNSDVKVYALWGYDSDNNNIADVKQKKYNVIYNVGCGITGSGPIAERNLLSSHNHVLLNQPQPLHETMDGVAIAFIGWSEERYTKKFGKDDEMPLLLTNVEILDDDLAVFAVWGYDSDSDGVADIYQEKYDIIYNINGGNSGSEPVYAKKLLAHDDFPLDFEVLPSHQPINGQEVVFIGWSLQRESKIFTKDDEQPNIITTVDVGGSDVMVYAVWGLDSDNDGQADVMQDKYVLTYDLNGGDSDSGPQKEFNILPTADYRLLETPHPLHADVDGKSVLFIGWSNQRSTKIYSRYDEAPWTMSAVEISNSDVTVYAVWSYDECGCGVADVLENKFHLKYDNNGGIENSGPNSEMYLFTHEKHELIQNPVPLHQRVAGKSVLFIGWTLEKTEKIFEKDDDKPKLVTDLYIVDGDVTVYAAWAYDSDGDGVADILENKYTLIYNINGGLTENQVPWEHGLLWTKDYVLNNKDIPQHRDVANQKVVFIGWSATIDRHYYGKDDDLPNIITQVDIINEDVTVYALWGFDSNDNGIADILEPKLKVIYNINGGMVNSGPENERNILADPQHLLKENPRPLHDAVNGSPVVFVGWSSQHDNKIYSKEDSLPLTIKEIALSDKNEVVYAVWGYDSDNNGIADVKQDKYNLIYDLNGGISGSAPAVEINILANTNCELQMTTKPTYHLLDGQKVVFVGWSLQRSFQIYTKDDILPQLISTVSMKHEDVRVYAVWGFDSNNDGIADILQEKYTLHYNVNGGIMNTGPWRELNLLAQKNHELLMAPKPQHQELEEQRVIFAGWSSEPDITIYKAGDGLPSLITHIDISDANQVVYAVWAYDVDGEGTPDYLQKRFNIYYDLNGGIEDTAPPEINDLLPSKKVYHLSAIRPQHEMVDNSPVLFVGWSLEAKEQIFTADDVVSGLIEDVIIDKQNITVYAVWGYDRNGDGIADAMEKSILNLDKRIQERLSLSFWELTLVALPVALLLILQRRKKAQIQ